jgi:hypothetical protein
VARLHGNPGIQCRRGTLSDQRIKIRTRDFTGHSPRPPHFPVFSVVKILPRTRQKLNTEGTEKCGEETKRQFKSG